MTKHMVITIAAVVGMFAAPTLATPPIWESDYGLELTDLTGVDDGAEDVTLSFLFPYAGNSYDSVFAGTNGAVALGGLGEADDYPSSDEFIETADPMIAPLWSDMSMESIGTAWFNDFGDRAVFTWDAIGSYQDDTAPNTFQLQMFQDGRIIFGYNGIQDVTSDFFDAAIHIGLTEGDLSDFPSVIDYTADAPFLTNDTILELFDYDVTVSEFDLDQLNILFTPEIGGGYMVTIPEPATLSLLALGGLLAIRRRR